jgi:hypothetical protein
MTFKPSEIKENIKYSIVKSLFKYNVGKIRYLVGNTMKNEYDTKAGDYPNDYHDGDWGFTCKYPDTIEEAAKILDAHCPGWETKVKSPRQNSSAECVLGQIFGDWRTGMLQLFNVDMDRLEGNPEEFNKYGHDLIFGKYSPNEEWEKQLALRAKKVEPKLLTFWEAMQALTEGKKVRRVTWEKNRYWMMVKSTSMVRSYTSGNMALDIPAPFGCHLLNDWELYTELTFKDLKAGDKFTSHNGPVWIKAEDIPYAVGASNPLAVCKFELTDEVKKVS